MTFAERTEHPRICDRATCVDPHGERSGTHYHCGRCDSGEVTSMYGHPESRCPATASAPLDLPAPSRPAPEFGPALRQAREVAARHGDWSLSWWEVAALVDELDRLRRPGQHLHP